MAKTKYSIGTLITLCVDIEGFCKAGQQGNISGYVDLPGYEPQALPKPIVYYVDFEKTRQVVVADCQLVAVEEHNGSLDDDL